MPRRYVPITEYPSGERREVALRPARLLFLPRRHPLAAAALPRGLRQRPAPLREGSLHRLQQGERRELPPSRVQRQRHEPGARGRGDRKTPGSLPGRLRPATRLRHRQRPSGDPGARRHRGRRACLPGRPDDPEPARRAPGPDVQRAAAPPVRRLRAIRLRPRRQLVSRRATSAARTSSMPGAAGRSAAEHTSAGSTVSRERASWPRPRPATSSRPSRASCSPSLTRLPAAATRAEPPARFRGSRRPDAPPVPVGTEPRTRRNRTPRRTTA